jgi:mRNA interferase MazF
MGTPSVGDVVIIPFPYSDLSQSKRRPALVLAGVGRGDFLLCQITPRVQERCHPSQSQTRGLDGAEQCVVTARRSRLMSGGG